jgi:ribosomal protein S18 acetylase RimI-like enzyme
MRELAAIQEVIYVAARSPELVGVIGCEFAVDLRRGWLRGPLIDKNDETIAHSLYEELLKHVPSEIERFDTYLNEHNVSGDAFYRSLDYQQAGRSHIYDTNAERAVIRESDCALLDTNQHESLIVLHDALFPDTFANGRELVDQLSTEKQIIVASEGERVLGYARTIKENDDEGYIEYVGVRSEDRRKGNGRKVLSKALDYLLNDVGVAVVTLCVNDDNAKSLYTSIGFSHRHTGINLRLQR